MSSYFGCDSGPELVFFDTGPNSRNCGRFRDNGTMDLGYSGARSTFKTYAGNIDYEVDCSGNDKRYIKCSGMNPMCCPCAA